MFMEVLLLYFGRYIHGHMKSSPAYKVWLRTEELSNPVSDSDIICQRSVKKVCVATET